MNRQMLVDKIRDSGLKTGFICEKLGMSRNSLKNRLEGKYEFTIRDVQTLCDLLRIKSAREREDIFFDR